MSSEERLTNLEEFVKLMTQWTLRAEERTDELRAAQAESEAKIAALADAQIKTESVMASLGGSMNELAAAQARAEQRFSEAQTHTEQRLDALIDIVREMRDGHPPKS
jgi:peptidoglycan hydrolase CwlO-like protein